MAPALREERRTLRAEDGAELAYVRRWVPSAAGEKGALILCPGFAQNHRAFDVPGRSMMDHLARAGFQVYALTLRGKHRSGLVAASRGHAFSHYVRCDAPAAIAWVKKRHGKVGWIGHSMGGLVGVSLAPSWQKEISALCCIGSPLKPGRSLVGHALLSRLGMSLVRRGQRRRVPLPTESAGQFLHRGSRPLDLPFVRFPLQVWAPGSMDKANLQFGLQETFDRESFGALADMMDLVRTDGEWAGDIPLGQRLRNLETPLLVIAGDRDGLATKDQVRALYERAGPARKSWLLLDRQRCGVSFGHLDLISGRAAPQWVWPQVGAFLDVQLNAAQ
jgi:pimeloyl-ACP methyl ester carboxylesterase